MDRSAYEARPLRSVMLLWSTMTTAALGWLAAPSDRSALDRVADQRPALERPGQCVSPGEVFAGLTEGRARDGERTLHAVLRRAGWVAQLCNSLGSHRDYYEIDGTSIAITAPREHLYGCDGGLELLVGEIVAAAPSNASIVTGCHEPRGACGGAPPVGQPNGAAPGVPLSVSGAYQIRRAISARSLDDARHLVTLGVPTVLRCAMRSATEPSLGRVRALRSQSVDGTRVDTLELEPIAGKARRSARCAYVSDGSARPRPGDFVVVGAGDDEVTQILVANDLPSGRQWHHRIERFGWPTVIDMASPRSVADAGGCRRRP